MVRGRVGVGVWVGQGVWVGVGCMFGDCVSSVRSRCGGAGGGGVVGGVVLLVEGVLVCAGSLRVCVCVCVCVMWGFA